MSPRHIELDEAFFDIFADDGGQSMSVIELARAAHVAVEVVASWSESARARGLVAALGQQLVLTERGRAAVLHRLKTRGEATASLGPWKLDPLFTEWSGPGHRN